MKVKLTHWLIRIGWGLGVTDCLAVFLLLLFMVIINGLNRWMVSLLWLILPVGLTGLVISLLSFFLITEEYPKERKLVKQGITLSLIGTLLGGLWFLMAEVVLRV